jgi:hypothetical protein
MKTIGLIQIGERHTEIIGGVATALLRKDTRLIVYTTRHVSSFVPYYKTVLPSTVKWVYVNSYYDKGDEDKLSERIQRDCDVYVFLTGYEFDEEDLYLPPENSLLITHHMDNLEESDEFETCGQVALSPVFNKTHITHFLNVFKAHVFSPPKKLDIVIAGLTNPDNKDLDHLYDAMSVIEENGNWVGDEKVQFHIINYYPLEDRFARFKKSKLLKDYIDVSGKKTIHILEKAAFVMVIAREDSSYHTSQLSGIIPLAVSCGVPLIMDQKLARMYGMSRIAVSYTFRGDYLLRAIVSASKKDISSMKKRVVIFRDKTINKNKKKRLPCI